ncbi:hypothetical protein CMZ84_10330 [Lysobacteraceae bacterium NML93-0399]|nr:hypothetical protein CMZ84_10330 [Xanthomonadaceae bacterium NML93-0399]
MSGLRAGFSQTLRAIAGDRYAMVAMIGAVLLYSVFYPSAYRHQVAGNLPIVVVDQDHSRASRALLQRVDALREVRIAAGAPDLPAARRALEAGEAEAIVLLPPGFERDILRGGQGQVVLLGNGAYLGRSATALGGIAEAVTAYAREAAAAQAAFMGVPVSPPVQVVHRPLFNTREGYGSSIVSGVSELIVHQTLLLGMGVLLGTRRQALGRRLQVAGRTLLGMAAAFWVIGLCGLLFYAGFTAWVQDYPRGGSLPGLLLAAGLFVAATVAFGLCVGSLFDTRERAFQYVTAVSIPLFFLSGLSWPAAMSPPALVALSKLLPIAPGMSAVVRANQMGATLTELAPALWNLVALTVLYGLLAAWRFRVVAPAGGMAAGGAR